MVLKPYFLVVVLGGLLDRDVREVDERVGDVARVVRVARVGEAREAAAEEVDLQWHEGWHECIEAQVELSVSLVW